MGGSLGKNKSTSTQNPAKVWEAQDPYLQDLYQKAATLTSRTPYFGPQRQITSGAMQGYQNQLGGGFQDPSLQQNLQGLGSGQYQNQALGGAIQAGLGDINRNFQRNIMPGINTGAAMTNTSGGSRQGIAQGLAAGEANRQAGDFVNRMYSENFGQMLNSMLGANQQLGGLQNMQNLAQTGAMQMAPSLSGMGINQQLAQYAPLQTYADILGGPTVLGQGGSSASRGWNVSGGVFNSG